MDSDNGHNDSFGYFNIEYISSLFDEEYYFLRKDNDGQCSFGEEVINASVVEYSMYFSHHIGLDELESEKRYLKSKEVPCALANDLSST